VTRTITTIACAALLVSAAACKKDKKAKVDKDEAAKTTEKMEKTPPAEEKPKLDTPEDKVAFYRACYAALSAKDMDKFGKCYADNIVSEHVDSGMPTMNGRDAVVEGVKMFTTAFPDANVTPTLILVNGNKMASVGVFTGTQSGPLKSPAGEIPATNKKVGMEQFHMVEVDPAAGGAVKEWFIYDQGTMMAQLGLSPMPSRPVMEAPTGEPTVVIAKDDDAEKANLALYKKSTEAWVKKDMKALSAMTDDKLVAHDMTAPKDGDKKSMDKMNAEVWKAFPDANGETLDVWAAGDYIVSLTKNNGTNKGAMPSMGLKKPTGKAMSFTSGDIAKIAGGKVVESWMFFNGMAIGKQLGLIPDMPAGGDKPADGAEKPADGAEKKMAPEGEKKMDDKAPAEGAGGAD
jgi:predicted ester cyclase